MQTSVALVLFVISAIRAEENGKKCLKANFLPDLGISAPQGKHCDFSNHCSKVTCTAKAGGDKLTVGVEITKCDDEAHTATVSAKDTANDVDWSHAFKDGEKAKLPKVKTAGVFTGGLQFSDASLFIQVRLMKINGSNLNYTVQLVGKVTVFGQVNPDFEVNTLLLQGISPSGVTAGDCGSWFSKQPVYVKVLMIVIPVTVLVFIGLGIAMYCYKRRRQGLGSGRVPMQRFTNEV